MCNKPNCNHYEVPRGFNVKASRTDGLITNVTPKLITPVSRNIVRAEFQTENLAEAQGERESLDLSWFPYAAERYCISKDLDNDYIFVTVPICPADLPNRNGISFPRAELLKFRGPPVGRITYKAWAGQPVHYNHKADDDTKAYGVILDTMIREDKYGILHVYGLLAIDCTKYVDVAEKVRTGQINTYSMGALIDYFLCSVCNAPLTFDPKNPKNSGWGTCSHIEHIEKINWKVVPVGGGRYTVAHLKGYGISPVETSIVPIPAWSTALSDIVM